MTREELVKELTAKAVARVKELKAQGQDVNTDEEVRRIVQAQLDAQKDLEDSSVRNSGGFTPDEKDLNRSSDDPLKGVKYQIDDNIQVDAKMILPASELSKFYQSSLVEKLLEWQKMNDDLLIVGTMLAGAINKNTVKITFTEALKSTKLYKQAMGRLKSDSELRKALDSGTAGSGAEWIPTGFSNQLVEKIRLQRKVAAIFPSINMPTNPYKVPVEAAGATGYLIPESTADDATRIKASTPTTSNFTFTAKKLAGRVVYSDEISEDAIINILAFTRDSLAMAIAEAIETAIINGDDSGTHQDTNVTSAFDAQKAFKGLRYYALNNGGTATKDAGGVNLSTMLLRSTRMLMGKHSVDPTKLYYIVSPNGYIQMLNLSELLTIDKYGPAATIMRGEAGKFDGGTLIVSEFMWDNLNASGKYDGVTTNKTSVVMVYAPAFWVGNRTGLAIATDRDIETDQMKLVAKTRIAFEDPYDATAAANVQSALLYDVKTTL